MIREISAGIIIYRKTIEGPRFLILYHGRDYWNFPKGKIESEERSFQTALREIKEETGITRNELKFQEYFKVFENFTFWRNNEKVYKTITFYLAETKRKAIKISDEKTGQPHEGFAWFTYKEALNVLSNHKDIMRVLKQAYDFLQKKGVVRSVNRQSAPRPIIKGAIKPQKEISRENGKTPPQARVYAPRPHRRNNNFHRNAPNNIQRKSP